MRKSVLLGILVLLGICCSCVLDNSTSDVLDNSTGYVSFSDVDRGITASISYPEIYDKTWTITAEKIDGGADTGEGTYENVLITDTFGPFSVGQWRFTLEGFSGETKVLEGTVETQIKVGNNTVSAHVHTTASDGKLSFEGSNFSMSEKGAVSKVLLIVDNEDAKSWTSIQMTTEDNDIYFLPTFTKTMSKGIHTLHLRYVFQSGDVFNEPDISFRIDGGAVTHITIGMTEGTFLFNITLDTVDAIV